MKVYNTLTSKVEQFVPREEGHVKMYTCGPTVYNFAHIGNLRTYIFEDILEKTLKYIGFDVTRCMNITDVGHLSSDADTGEDKMLKGAKRENKSVLEIAQFYTEAFQNDCQKLNIRWPDIVSKATDNIDKYMEIIETLLEKEYAYIAGGNVYFDTSKLEEYYTLTNHVEDELAVAVREDVEEDKNKRNKTDFVLWFTKSKFDSQELKWDSPWGKGYPGWHIECTGISINNLGEYLDIHCGGVDNIFPHHTNEIAQSEAYLGHKWCSYWMHGEFLNDQTGKMSKSKGEFLTVSLLEQKGYNPIVYRFMCLQSHYRKGLIFTYDSLDNTTTAYKKLKSRVLSVKNEGTFEEQIFSEWDEKFKVYMEDDLNTANAITLVYDLLKTEMSGSTKYKLIEQWDKVLSLDLLKEEQIEVDDKAILEQIEERNEAKRNKDYQKSDAIRDHLLEQGIRLIDSRDGTTYEII